MLCVVSVLVSSNLGFGVWKEQTLIQKVRRVFSVSVQLSWRLEGLEFDSVRALFSVLV